MKFHVSFDLSFVTNSYNGKYYALEGIDGSGKTTQVEKLATYFRKRGQDVIVTKEPTDGVIGQLIKKIVRKKLTVPSMSLQYLFSADRAVHLEKEVIPALKMGKIVISDRSFWSAVAYGITDLSLHEGERERLLLAYNVLAMYSGYLIADKTFVINVPHALAMKRVKKRKQTITLYENEERLEKVQEEYIWMAKKFSNFLYLIDGTKSKEDVFAEIRNQL
jgi:dTMP kinase